MKRNKKAVPSLESMKQTAKMLTKGFNYKVLVNDRVAQNYEGVEILYPKLCVTTNYEFSTFHSKNRKITHARQMQNSVNNLHKVLRPVVIAEYKAKYYILDGQNLYMGLKNAGLPIEFYLFEVKTDAELIKVMRQMNSCSVRWGINQFVNVNTSTDKRKNAYDKLKMYVDKYTTSVGMTTKVMSAIMYNEHHYNEGSAVNAIKGDYFVQNVPDCRVKKRLDSLKRFYRFTKMTPTNYLNAAYIEMLYDKQDVFFKNEKDFFKSVKDYAIKTDKLSDKYGNRKNAFDLLDKSWVKMAK